MKKILLSSLALTVLTFASCKKKSTTEECTTCVKDLAADMAKLAAFHEINVPASQNFTVTAGTLSSITTARGSKLTFPPNCMIGPAGVITSGPVSVEVKEITDKVDFLLANKGTASNGLPLESAGTWMIKLKVGTADARINPAVPLVAQIPRDAVQTANGGAMQLFNAQPAGGVLGGAINWGQPRPAVLDTITQQGPIGQGIKLYGFQIDSVGWGNADRFMSNPIYVANTKLVAEGASDMSSMTCAFVYKGRKIIWRMNSVTAAGATDGHIAQGQIGHFIAYGFVNGVFTTGILQDQTVTGPNQTFTVKLVPQSEAAFKAQLTSIL